MSSSAAYRERLLPRWWAWLVPLGVVAMLAVAYGAALGALAGWLVALAGLGIVGVLLWVTAPVIEASPAGLRVGSAMLPAASIGSVEAVSADDIARLRGPGADARLFTALRPWSARDGVIITLDDPVDPHPAWLISSRNPERVVEALAQTTERAATMDATMETNDGRTTEDA
jgi:hypothetical protein